MESPWVVLADKVYYSGSEEEIQLPPNNEIWYTSDDGEIITLTSYNTNPFNVSLVSNTYEDGKGVLKFDGEVTTIGQNAPVFDYDILTSIIIPDSVTSIGDNAFHGCGRLKSIEIPNSVTSIGDTAFGYCLRLRFITYKGTTYISRSALISALTDNGVTILNSAFSNTDLDD